MDEYRSYAWLYDLLVGPFLYPMHEAMVNMLQRHNCSSFLDLCCGTGLFVGKAREVGMEPFGIDLSPSMLGVARRNHPGIDFFESDASALPIVNDSFDAATLSFALHEKPRNTALDILQEAIRVVRPGGIIVVSDFCNPIDKDSRLTGWGIKCVERMAGKEHHAHFQDFMRCGGTKSFLANAGLHATCQSTHMRGWAGVFIHQLETECNNNDIG